VKKLNCIYILFIKEYEKYTCYFIDGT